MKVRQSLISALSSVALVLVSIGASTPHAAAASSTPACTDVYVVGARGTDQPYNDKGVGGWYADVVGRTVDQFKTQVRQRDGSIQFHDIALTASEYPADGGWYFTGAIFHVPSTYHKSVTKGKDSGRQHIKEVIGKAGACVLFTGYSQGAQVAADLMEEFTATYPSAVLGGIFYGDPYFRGDSKHSSSGLWPNSYNPKQHGGLGQRPAFAASLNDRVISTCHGKDPVCQGVSWSGVKPDIDLDAHSSYTRDAENPANRGNDMTAEAANSARAIVARMGFVRPSAPQYSGPVDIVFAVDTTGSMGGIIEDAKTYVRSFPSKTDSALPDVHYGLVAYRDLGDEYVTRVEVPPTADRAAFTSGVDRLSADGGGDTPEAVLAAASAAMDTPMRATARKVVIFVGDAPAHDPDMVTGDTVSGVTTTAVKKSIILSAVDYSGGTSTFPELAAATGGAVINPYAIASMGMSLPSGESTSGGANANPKPRQLSGGMTSMGATDETDRNPLLDAVVQSVAKPEARLSALLPSYVGRPTTFNASASSDPIGYIAKYEWDYDNDGTYDQSTNQPTVERTFGTAGMQTVGLRVTNDVGDTGLATVNVNVENVPAGYPNSAPAKPDAPKAVAKDASAVVTIVPNRTGPTPRSYTVSDGATGQVVAIVPADTSGKPSGAVTVGALANGKKYSFRVLATNAIGDGAISVASTSVTPTKAKPADGRAKTSTTVSASRTTVKVGKKVTLTAVVTGSAGGRVQFRDSGHNLGSAPVLRGKAVLKTKSLYGGRQEITAAFVGTSTRQPSSGKTSLKVKDGKRPTLTLKAPKKRVAATGPVAKWSSKDKGGVKFIRLSSKVGKGPWKAAVTVAPSASPYKFDAVRKGTRVCVRARAYDWAGNKSQTKTRCGVAK